MKAKATGKPSTFGRSARARSILNPWGKPIPGRQGRGANGIGQTRNTAKVRRSGGVRMPKADSQLRGMNYRANDPQAWPVMPDVTADPPRRGGGPETNFTQAKADKNNAAVNRAFQRGGYAG